MRYRIPRLAVLLLLPILWTTTILAGQAQEQAAVREAESWLSAVDSGGYAASWEGAASFFKNAVTKEKWLGSMHAYRKPLGAMLQRNLRNAQYTTSLPGAPDGEYVVIQYDSAFEGKKKEAVETITPMLDAGGQWRVSGYFIK